MVEVDPSVREVARVHASDVVHTFLESQPPSVGKKLVETVVLLDDHGAEVSGLCTDEGRKNMIYTLTASAPPNESLERLEGLALAAAEGVDPTDCFARMLYEVAVHRCVEMPTGDERYAPRLSRMWNLVDGLAKIATAASWTEAFRVEPGQRVAPLYVVDFVKEFSLLQVLRDQEPTVAVTCLVDLAIASAARYPVYATEGLGTHVERVIYGATPSAKAMRQQSNLAASRITGDQQMTELRTLPDAPKKKWWRFWRR